MPKLNQVIKQYWQPSSALGQNLAIHHTSHSRDIQRQFIQVHLNILLQHRDIATIYSSSYLQDIQLQQRHLTTIYSSSFLHSVTAETSSDNCFKFILTFCYSKDIQRQFIQVHLHILIPQRHLATIYSSSSVYSDTAETSCDGFLKIHLNILLQQIQYI